jgi:O-antigen/teichoic acid export membrane protein
MSQRASGAVLSYVLILVKLVITLLITPFLVASLGLDGYGLYALVGALAAYLYILDFGMNDAVLRFFVRHEKNHAERDAFLARMLGLYFVIGALVLGATLGLRALSTPLFDVNNTPEQVDMLREMILLTGGGAAILVALNPVGALLSATESFVFLRSMEIGVTVVSAVVMVIVLRAGHGPVEVVMVSASFMALQALMRLVYAAVKLRVRIRMALPDMSELSRVGGYAAPIFVSMIAEVIFWKFDSILIGATIGVASIAIYSIGVTFNKYFMSFATALSRVMAPQIIRRVDGGASPQDLTDEMIRISRMQALFLLLILSGLIVYGERFLILWIGPEFTLSYWVMLAVLVPYTLELTGNARNIILQVKRLYWQKSAITVLLALLNIPLTILFLRIWGVLGAALSTGLAILVGYLLIAVLLKKRVGMEMGRYWMQTARGILPVAILMAVVGLIIERQMPDGWLALGIGVLMYTFVYTLAMYRFVMGNDERIFVKELLGRSLGRGEAA